MAGNLQLVTGRLNPTCKWSAGFACLFFSLFSPSVISVLLPSPLFLSFFHPSILSYFHLSSLGLPVYSFLAALLPFSHSWFLLSLFLQSVVLSFRLCFTCRTSLLFLLYITACWLPFCLSSFLFLSFSYFLSLFIFFLSFLMSDLLTLSFHVWFRFGLFLAFFIFFVVFSLLLFRLKVSVVAFSTLSRFTTFTEFRI